MYGLQSCVECALGVFCWFVCAVLSALTSVRQRRLLLVIVAMMRRLWWIGYKMKSVSLLWTQVLSVWIGLCFKFGIVGWLWQSTAGRHPLRRVVVSNHIMDTFKAMTVGGFCCCYAMLSSCWLVLTTVFLCRWRHTMTTHKTQTTLCSQCSHNFITPYSINWLFVL